MVLITLIVDGVIILIVFKKFRSEIEWVCSKQDFVPYIINTAVL